MPIVDPIEQLQQENQPKIVDPLEEKTIIPEPFSMMPAHKVSGMLGKERSERGVRALSDAHAMKISPQLAYFLSKQLDEREKTDPELAQKRTSAWDRVKLSWETGVKQNEIGEIGYKYIMTGDPQYLDKIGSIQMPEQLESEGKVEYAIRSAAKLLPMMLDTGRESISKGLTVGMGFGGMTALLGQAGPQAAFPEEILTVPAATALGFKIGATEGAYEATLRKEGGLAVYEIMNMEDEAGNQIDPNIARGAAFGVGAINAGIELLQIKLLLDTIPGADKIFSDAIMKTVTSKFVKNKLMQLGARYAGTVAVETAQEVVQESVNITFEEFAKQLNDAMEGSDFGNPDIETMKGWFDRLYETAKESAAGFAVIAAPGTVTQAGLDLAGKKKGEKKTTEPGAAPEAAAEQTEMSEEEVKKTLKDLGDQVDEADIDRILNAPEEELNTILEEVLTNVEKEAPKITRFREQALAVLGDDAQADAITQLIEARAQAVGMSADEYIEYHGLEIRQGKLEDSPVYPESLTQEEENIENNPNFQKWSKGYDIIEGWNIIDADPNSGHVFKVYHGTTHDFDVFDPTVKGQKEGQFGQVNYFTSDYGDADQNYAGEGPDLTNRIQYLAEQLDNLSAEELSERLNIDIDEAEAAAGNDLALKQLAREMLSGSEAQIKEVYVRLDNPAFIGGPKETWIEAFEEPDQESIDEAWEEVKSDYDLTEEDRQDYEGEVLDRARDIFGYPENMILEAIDEAVRETGNDSTRVMADSAMTSEVFFVSEISATNLEEALRDNDELSSLDDLETGELISHHVIGRVFQILGYDGIVLQNADQRFKNMDMGAQTAHVHTFKETPSQIKSTENLGSFDPDNPNILYQQAAESIEQFSKRIKEEIGLQEFSIFERRDGTIELSLLIVPNEKRKEGVGSRAVEALVEYADKSGKRVYLNPAQKDDIHGTTSRNRLIKFYKRFGFVENKGRNKDFRLPPGMYREPKGFRQGTKGSILFQENQTIIKAFESADLSTMIHELGHLFRRDLSLEDLDIAEAWAGVVNGNWTRENEEKFARGFERYLQEGKAPAPELQSIFEQFKEWLTEIYRVITGSSIDVNLTPEIRSVFDRLLAEQEEVSPRKGITELRQMPFVKKDILVKSEAIDEETGKIVTVEENSDVALAAIKERISAYNKLLECLTI